MSQNKKSLPLTQTYDFLISFLHEYYTTIFQEKNADSLAELLSAMQLLSDHQAVDKAVFLDFLQATSKICNLTINHENAVDIIVSPEQSCLIGFQFLQMYGGITTHPKETCIQQIIDTYYTDHSTVLQHNIIEQMYAKKTRPNSYEKAFTNPLSFQGPWGHFTQDSKENRNLLLNAAQQKNFQITDQYGVDYYAQILDDTRQIWVSVKNGYIQNGGVNITPRNYQSLV